MHNRFRYLSSIQSTPSLSLYISLSTFILFWTAGVTTVSYLSLTVHFQYISTTVQRNRQEFQESLDFSEAERTALAEENAELGGKVSSLAAQLSEANQLHEEAR